MEDLRQKQLDHIESIRADYGDAKAEDAREQYLYENDLAFKAMNRNFKKHGFSMCEKAWMLAEAGDGSSTIGIEMGKTTRQIDAMIDAWNTSMHVDRMNFTLD